MSNTPSGGRSLPALTGRFLLALTRTTPPSSSFRVAPCGAAPVTEPCCLTADSGRSPVNFLGGRKGVHRPAKPKYTAFAVYPEACIVGTHTLLLTIAWGGKKRHFPMLRAAADTELVEGPPTLPASPLAGPLLAEPCCLVSRWGLSPCQLFQWMECRGPLYGQPFHRKPLGLRERGAGLESFFLSI